MRTIPALIILLSLLVLSCREDQESTKKPCCSGENADAPAAELSGESLYQLGSVWTTQNAEELKLESFRGGVVLTAMIFTHCESACPRLVADLKRIEASLTDEELKQIRFLLLSMDPERDTPAQLSLFAENHSLGERWTLVSSDPEATMEMANVLGVRVKKLEDGGFDHSNIIHFLDEQGLIRHQQNGFSDEVERLVQTVREML